jgi:hypothetical protein
MRVNAALWLHRLLHAADSGKHNKVYFLPLIFWSCGHSANKITTTETAATTIIIE